MVQHGHFPKKSLAEILFRAEIVVWGKNLRHYAPNPKIPVENSEFQVYCVYKVTYNKESALWSKMKKKHRQNSRLIIHFPTSEGVSEVSGASERVSAAEGASKANSPE